MRYLRTTMIVAASLVLTVLLGLAGCDENRRGRIRNEPERYERNDRDRHDERKDRDRHEDRGRDSDRDRDKHGDR